MLIVPFEMLGQSLLQTFGACEGQFSDAKLKLGSSVTQSKDTRVDLLPKVSTTRFSSSAQFFYFPAFTEKLFYLILVVVVVFRHLPSLLVRRRFIFDPLGTSCRELVVAVFIHSWQTVGLRKSSSKQNGEGEVESGKWEMETGSWKRNEKSIILVMHQSLIVIGKQQVKACWLLGPKIQLHLLDVHLNGISLYRKSSSASCKAKAHQG